MTEVSFDIGGYTYKLACAPHDVAQLTQLASIVDAQVRAAQAAGPQLTEVRGLLFAALNMADALPQHDPAPQRAPHPDAALTTALTQVAEQLEGLAAALENMLA